MVPPPIYIQDGKDLKKSIEMTMNLKLIKTGLKNPRMIQSHGA